MRLTTEFTEKAGINHGIHGIHGKQRAKVGQVLFTMPDRFRGCNYKRFQSGSLEYPSSKHGAKK